MEVLWGDVPTFPQFKDLTLEDKSLFETAFSRFPPSISEFTFTNLFIWRHRYQPKVSRFKDFICLLSDQEKNPFFFPPIGGGDVIECYQVLLKYLQEGGRFPKVSRVPEDVATQIDWKAEGLMAELDRNQSDYIYRTEDLINLEGRKYHRKRNHIKQFEEKYSYQYVSLTPEWIPECLRLQTEWCDLRHCEAIPGLAIEAVAIKEALTHFEALGLRGGAILINSQVEAFTLGEPLNPDTVVIHIEKANPAFDGLYPMINQAFLEHHWSDYAYVNREQDLGEEGLRKSKESYFPHHMIHKFNVTMG
jgi:hypothetical protein